MDNCPKNAGPEAHLQAFFSVAPRRRILCSERWLGSRRIGFSRRIPQDPIDEVVLARGTLEDDVLSTRLIEEVLELAISCHVLTPTNPGT